MARTSGIAGDGGFAEAALEIRGVVVTLVARAQQARLTVSRVIVCGVLLLSRLIAASAYAGAAFLFGMFLGERGELGFVQYVFAGVIPLAATVLAVVARKGRAHVIATGLAMLAGLLLGQRQFSSAWDDCVVSGDRVRAGLVEHRVKTGAYPTRLDQLEMTLPCRAGFRRTILRYRANERGFTLWFSNDRDRYVATDRTSFRSSGRS